MRKAVILKTTGEAEVVEIPGDSESGGLEALQNAVGGYIQLVPISDPKGDPDETFTMYCNEEGKLHSLDYNSPATRLSGLWPHDVIVGDAIILGPVGGEGETLGLTDAQVELFKQYAEA